MAEHFFPSIPSTIHSHCPAEAISLLRKGHGAPTFANTTQIWATRQKGNTGAAFYYATVALLAVGLANVVPYLANQASSVGVSDEMVSSQGQLGLWRGVARSNPGYGNALNGVAEPIGGGSSPADHILGNTNSSYTSWTSDPSVAARFAGKDGAVIYKVFNASDLIDSTQVPGTNADMYEPEFEYLVTGRVSGAVVVKQ